MTAAPMNAIVVLHAFGPYSRGEMVSDPATISAILSGGHASMVIPTQVLPHYPGGIATGEEH